MTFTARTICTTNMQAPIKVKTQLVCVCESALHLVLNVGWAGVFFIPVFQMRREVPEELRQRHWTSHPAQSCYTEPRRTASKQAPGHDRIRPGAAANVLKSLALHAWPPTVTAPSSSGQQPRPASDRELQWADLAEEESTALVPMQSITFDSNFPFVKWC